MSTSEGPAVGRPAAGQQSPTEGAGEATSPSGAEHTSTPQYKVRVGGRLGSRWAAWFDGLSVSAEDDGTTVVRGPVVDQAALHGLLQKLRDVGIPLVSLTPLLPDAPTTEGPAPQHEGN